MSRPFVMSRKASSRLRWLSLSWCTGTPRANARSPTGRQRRAQKDRQSAFTLCTVPRAEVTATRRDSAPGQRSTTLDPALSRSTVVWVTSRPRSIAAASSASRETSASRWLDSGTVPPAGGEVSGSRAAAGFRRMEPFAGSSRTSSSGSPSTAAARAQALPHAQGSPPAGRRPPRSARRSRAPPPPDPWRSPAPMRAWAGGFVRCAMGGTRRRRSSRRPGSSAGPGPLNRTPEHWRRRHQISPVPAPS